VQNRAYAAAVILTLIVLVLSISTSYLIKKIILPSIKTNTMPSTIETMQEKDIKVESIPGNVPISK